MTCTYPSICIFYNDNRLVSVHCPQHFANGRYIQMVQHSGRTQCRWEWCCDNRPKRRHGILLNQQVLGFMGVSHIVERDNNPDCLVDLTFTGGVSAKWARSCQCAESLTLLPLFPSPICRRLLLILYASTTSCAE